MFSFHLYCTDVLYITQLLSRGLFRGWIMRMLLITVSLILIGQTAVDISLCIACICFYPKSQEFKSKFYAAHLMVLFESTCCWTVDWLFLQTSPEHLGSRLSSVSPVFLVLSFILTFLVCNLPFTMSCYSVLNIHVIMGVTTRIYLEHY